MASRFILGPPGPAVIMSRLLIEALIKEYGYVYDPHFFLYGEDVDLYLRVRDLGFETMLIGGSVETGDVIWHIGSASTAAGVIPTVSKNPKMVRLVLSGCWDNAVGHSGLVELPVVLLGQVLFRLLFYLQYWRTNSLQAVVDLLRPASCGPRPRALVRKNRCLRPRLLPRVSLIHRIPFPWARLGHMDMERSNASIQSE